MSGKCWFFSGTRPPKSGVPHRNRPGLSTVFGGGQVALQIAGQLAVRPGQGEIGLGFVGPALGKPIGLMGARWRR